MCGSQTKTKEKGKITSTRRWPPGGSTPQGTGGRWLFWALAARTLSALSQRQGWRSESVQICQIWQKTLERQPLASCKWLIAEIESCMILNGTLIRLQISWRQGCPPQNPAAAQQVLVAQCGALWGPQLPFFLIRTLSWGDVIDSAGFNLTYTPDGDPRFNCCPLKHLPFTMFRRHCWFHWFLTYL